MLSFGESPDSILELKTKIEKNDKHEIKSMCNINSLKKHFSSLIATGRHYILKLKMITRDKANSFFPEFLPNKFGLGKIYFSVSRLC